jgi:hypothetical protein
MESLSVLNFDEVFADSVGARVIPCNTEVLKTKKQVVELMKYIFADGGIRDVLNTSCDCGKSQGGYKLGSTCPKCGTLVRESTAHEIGYSAWLEIPECLPPLLQPLVYNTLKKWMGKYQRQSLLDMFLNPECTLPEPLSEHFQTGVWYFYENFDRIMEYLLNEYRPLKMYLKRKRGDIVKENKKSIGMQDYLKINRAACFARYFPVLDKNLHVLNKQGTMSDADQTSQYILKAAIEIANVNLVNSMSSAGDKKTLEYYGFGITTTYATYASAVLGNNMLTKYGFFRRHILGSRCHYTFRAVIVPITDLSLPDELKLPWSVAVPQFKLEILNLLIRRMGYSFTDAQLKHQQALERYDKEIHDILKTLITECPYKGIPVLLGRNPTLTFGGIQFFFVTEIKTDLVDDTISMHALAMPPPNADADGDALYGTPLKEMCMVPYYMKMHPCMALLTSQTLEISDIITIDTQASVTLTSWLEEGREFVS